MSTTTYYEGFTGPGYVRVGIADISYCIPLDRVALVKHRQNDVTIYHTVPTKGDTASIVSFSSKDEAFDLFRHICGRLDDKVGR